MKHAFSSAVADGADTTLVRPTNWNRTHVYGVSAVSLDTTLTALHDYVRATGGAAGITLTLPSAASQGGQPYTIKKVDADVGSVTVSPAGGQTIDGGSSYALIVQYQYVILVSNGSNWEIVGNN